jgi:phage shock protein PspC (stress-responsive transcriptional regulator)
MSSSSSIGELFMTVFCQHCGTGLPANARFCSTCGVVITAGQPIPGRPLIRPRVGRQIGGVCLAIAQANGWDVAVVRIIAVLGLIFSGCLIGVAYLAAWIGIPEETAPMPGVYPPGV